MVISPRTPLAHICEQIHLSGAWLCPISTQFLLVVVITQFCFGLLLIWHLFAAHRRLSIPADALAKGLQLSNVHIALVDRFARFTKIIGTSPAVDYAMGKRGDEMFPSDGQRRMTELRLKAMDTAQPQTATIPDLVGVEVSLVRAVEVVVVPIFQRRNITGALSIVVDINAQRLAEKEVQEKIAQLTQAREEAEKAAKAKSDFLSVMSHEIRTPLNGVIGTAQLLADTNPLNEQQKEYADMILRSGRCLVRIINNILDFSKIEAGKLELERRAFDLPALVQETVDTVAQIARQQKDVVITKLDPTLPKLFVGDSYRIFQVLVNLVSNAVKFTQGGVITINVANVALSSLTIKTDSATLTADLATGIKVDRDDTKGVRVEADKAHGVSVSANDLAVKAETIKDITVQSEHVAEVQRKPIEPKQYQLKFTVTDSGIGIEDAVLPQLFKPFIQADQSTTRFYGGTGLGLAICKRLVEAMDGEIGVSSKVGSGSSFWFTIPLAAAPSSSSVKQSPTKQPIFPVDMLPVPVATASAPTAACPADSAPASGESRPVVLVAEDNVVNQKVAVHMLNRLGFDADIAVNGSEAVDKVRSNPNKYYAVLMDAQMPVMDGEAAATQIRRMEEEGKQQRHLPIIALTGDALIGSRERFLQAGMDDYLAKPVMIDQLREALARAGSKR